VYGSLSLAGGGGVHICLNSVVVLLLCLLNRICLRVNRTLHIPKDDDNVFVCSVYVYIYVCVCVCVCV